MSTFKNIKPGDEIWVINGHQNSAFEANVIEVTEDIIAVEVPEKKGAVYTFDREGQAVEGPFVSKSFLALDDDWKVKVILDRKEHSQYHEDLIALASEFKWDPSTDNAEKIRQLANNWTAFTANADPVALISASVTEYEEAKAVAQA